MRNRIRLSEGQLRRVIKESVYRMLNELDMNHEQAAYLAGSANSATQGVKGLFNRIFRPNYYGRKLRQTNKFGRLALSKNSRDIDDTENGGSVTHNGLSGHTARYDDLGRGSGHADFVSSHFNNDGVKVGNKKQAFYNARVVGDYDPTGALTSKNSERTVMSPSDMYQSATDFRNSANARRQETDDFDDSRASMLSRKARRMEMQAYQVDALNNAFVNGGKNRGGMRSDAYRALKDDSRNNGRGTCWQRAKNW